MKSIFLFLMFLGSLFADVGITQVGGIPIFTGSIELTSFFTALGVLVAVLSIVQSIKLALSAFGINIGGKYSSKGGRFNARY